MARFRTRRNPGTRTLRYSSPFQLSADDHDRDKSPVRPFRFHAVGWNESGDTREPTLLRSIADPNAASPSLEIGIVPRSGRGECAGAANFRVACAIALGTNGCECAWRVSLFQCRAVGSSFLYEYPRHTRNTIRS